MHETPHTPLTPEIASAFVAQKCSEDKEFRRSLRENPHQALHRATGVEIPDDLEICIHENQPGQWHIPLPSAQLLEALQREEKNKQDKSLSDEELEHLSGGMLSYFIIGLGVPVVIGAAIGATLALGATATAIGVAQTRGNS